MSSSITPIESGQSSVAEEGSLPHRSNGPSAHEDLTISEQIDVMRLTDEHRPGEECFQDSHGEHHWVPSVEVQRFIRKFGAEHPSNYLSKHGTEWEDDFFNISQL